MRHTCSRFLSVCTRLAGVRGQKRTESLIKRMASSFAADRTSVTGENVWVEFTTLAAKHNAVNLGQGFPDFAAPLFLKKALADAVMNDPLNQYTRSMGHLRLVQVLANVFSPVYGRQLNPLTEMFTAVGGYGVLFSLIHGLVNPGDEVIIIEPFFDCYLPMVKMANGIPKFVSMKLKNEGGTSAKDFVLDRDELAAAFSPKTKAIIINTPHNPLGKVYSRDELTMIAELCKENNVVCISDEVYEWLVFDGLEHIKIATLPGMWERTVTVGSGGKTFSATGWKLGWAIGPTELIKCGHDVLVQTTYTCPTPIQEAIAVGFEHELAAKGTDESYFKGLSLSLAKKRDLLVKLLTEAGMKPIVPEGGYFLVADTAPLNLTFKSEKNDPYDYEFCRWFTKERGIACIPPSAFYSDKSKHLTDKLIRFCFAKKDSTLEAAVAQLKDWKGQN
ncbi:kynurenine--oxoglutarate transaminase 3-like [Corticium candelabrum]|uniref:kynurenine--oxoglutarate transaminase 3-like n=1 Tax=Corticium candelabrum TaxID=121492 RepID=UPI002E257197|nr:kynurenine--oxoglutarate transaminase 3-like [Corticium candelabrum]